MDKQIHTLALEKQTILLKNTSVSNIKKFIVFIANVKWFVEQIIKKEMEEKDKTIEIHLETFKDESIEEEILHPLQKLFKKYNFILL